MESSCLCDSRMQLLPCACDMRRAGVSETPVVCLGPYGYLDSVAEVADVETRKAA
jgi:hypothetical protein